MRRRGVRPALGHGGRDGRDRLRAGSRSGSVVEVDHRAEAGAHEASVRPSPNGAHARIMAETSAGADRCWCAARTSNPSWGPTKVLGGFNSHALPPSVASARASALPRMTVARTIPNRGSRDFAPCARDRERRLRTSGFEKKRAASPRKPPRTFRENRFSQGLRFPLQSDFFFVRGRRSRPSHACKWLVSRGHLADDRDRKAGASRRNPNKIDRNVFISNSLRNFLRSLATARSMHDRAWLHDTYIYITNILIL